MVPVLSDHRLRTFLRCPHRGPCIPGTMLREEMEEQIRCLQEEVRVLKEQLSEIREKLGLNQQRTNVFTPAPISPPLPAGGSVDADNNDSLTRRLLDAIRVKFQGSEDPLGHPGESHLKPIPLPREDFSLGGTIQKPVSVHNGGPLSQSKPGRDLSSEHSESPKKVGIPEKQEKEKRRYDPCPMKYSELLPLLLQNDLAKLLPARRVLPPYAKPYDPDARCAYHSGMVGHSTEKCISLRNKVQKLIDEKWLIFDTSSNPLPQHSQIRGHKVVEINTEDASELQQTFVCSSSSGAVKNWEVQEVPAATYSMLK